MRNHTLAGNFFFISETKCEIDTESVADEGGSLRKNVSTDSTSIMSMETNSKGNINNRHIKGSTLQIPLVSAETELYSTIDNSEFTGLMSRKKIMPKRSRSQNYNERHHDTCFSEQDINNLNELVSNVSKISRLMKQHSNTGSEDQLQSSKQNVEKSMVTNSDDVTAVSSALRERHFESENLMKEKEGMVTSSFKGTNSICILLTLWTIFKIISHAHTLRIVNIVIDSQN